MQNLRNKSMAILIALFMIISMSATIMLQPNVSAHSPPWTVISYAYVVAAPDPVGVGQTLSVSFWIDYPFTGATLFNNIRRTGYTLTITAPDGTNSTETYATVSDSTGIQSISYVPTQVGTYTFTFNYAGQTYTWTAAQGGSTTYDGDIMLPASANTSVTVQQTAIPATIDSYPLPTAFWTYPIEGQNTYWYTVASNWLSAPYIIGAAPGTHDPGTLQPYGTAPNSAHIMWDMPIQYGGVAGGNNSLVPGEMYYEGSVYNPRFNSPIIMQGTLFFQEPYGNGGTGGNYVAVDLKTGQQLWSINASATGISLVPSFGYLYSYNSPNQYGTLPNGLLIATASVTGLGTVWRGYDPMTGALTTMNITNVPTGAGVAGPLGEYLKLILTNYGNSTKPNWYMSEWNSSLAFGGGDTATPINWYSGTVNASLPSCYDWNVSINLGGSPTGWAVGTYAGGAGNNYLVDPGNYVLFVQGTFGCHEFMSATITASLTTDPANITAISLNPATLGQTLWSKTFQQAPNNVTRTIAAFDPVNGVFIFEDKETFAHWGYSATTGDELWGPTATIDSSTNGWDYTSLDNDAVYQGNLLYNPGYNGVLYAYNDLTGALVWTWGSGTTADNSTEAEFATAFGIYPAWISTMADGKLYLQGDVHSPNSPLWKGQQLYCLNATTGLRIWSIFNYAQSMYNSIAPVASGYLVAFNGYDSQIYCFGQGPSATTVTAPDIAATVGTPLVIRGTVLDVSAGTKQNEQAADFPYGVPAVSDASMSQWMEYVYMQKPIPTNTTGVPVTLSVIDSNGNYRQIGTTTTDSSGMFTYSWAPDIPGSYTVIATFAGSNSYYGSSAETSFYATTAPATPAPTATAASNLATTTDLMTYIAVAVIAIIIAIAIVGLLLLRKHP